MAKGKRKPISKKNNKPEESESEHEQVEEPKPAAKGKPKAQPKLNIFSDDFNNKISNFKEFYNEFIDLRGGDSDKEQVLHEVTERVAESLENACSKVLKEDIQEAEKWIGEQQSAISSQIVATEKAIEDSRNALQSAGTFSAEEIDNNTAGIRSKKEKLQKSFDDFGALRSRATEIYSKSQAKMDEE